MCQPVGKFGPLSVVINFLENTANELDHMVEQNCKHGWSTNNNKNLTDKADQCRRHASILRSHRESL